MLSKMKGISLLEILLVLTVVASLTVLSIRYFTSAHQNWQVNRAIDEINRITHASYEWLQENNRAGFAVPTPITIERLIQAGLLTRHDNKNNWGGDILVAPGTEGRYVKITLNNIPVGECENLANQLKTISALAASTCARKEYVGEF